MQLSRNQTGELLFVGFNQDCTCFASATDNGFTVHNCNPYKETFHRYFKGGIGYIEMLFRSNILALIGGGKDPQYAPNKVMLWDDNQTRCIGELSFRSPVRSVKLRRDLIAVVLESTVYVYNFADLQLKSKIDTCSNSKGLCLLCPFSSNPILACPGMQIGHVRVELYIQKKTMLIEAHDSALACMAFNYEGTRIATASEQGTLIRVFDLSNGNALQELRRGSGKAEIYSLSFNLTTTYLACSSDKGTIHVFSLLSSKEKRPRKSSVDNSYSMKDLTNQTSNLSFLSGLLPYFASEWSSSQFYLPRGKTIVSFGEESNVIIALTGEGSYHKLRFNPENPAEEWIEDQTERFANKVENDTDELP